MYRNGVRLELAGARQHYTPMQVSINAVITILPLRRSPPFSPVVAEIAVPWETLLLFVVLFVVIPLMGGYATSKHLENRHTQDGIDRHSARLKQFSILGQLFGFQAQTIVDNPLVLDLIAVPLLIQTYGKFACGCAYLWRVLYFTDAPAALVGISNFFELAVAVAISLFGLDSGAALATMAGVLVEAPAGRLCQGTTQKFLGRTGNTATRPAGPVADHALPCT